MTDNEKLARWQGKCWHKSMLYIDYYHDQVDWKCEYCGYGDTKNPDYLNDDAAAMSLLDTLVEKGFDPALFYYRGHNTWYLQIFDGELATNYLQRPTRREAVVAAVLELIKKEVTNDQTR